MPADAPQQRWRDVDGTPISLFCSLFCEVETGRRRGRTLAAGLPATSAGHVGGRGLDSPYVCFPNNQMISVRPHLPHHRYTVPHNGKMDEYMLRFTDRLSMTILLRRLKVPNRSPHWPSAIS
jgi:hypothetical protein